MELGRDGAGVGVAWGRYDKNGNVFASPTERLLASNSDNNITLEGPVIQTETGGTCSRSDYVITFELKACVVYIHSVKNTKCATTCV